MSILDVLKRRLAERKPAMRSGIPGVNDVIRPGNPSYPAPPPQEMTHQTAPPPPSGIPPQYAQSVYDRQNSAYNRLEQLRSTGGGYGRDRFYSQGEIYSYDPTLQGYRGSISGSIIQQPQGERPAEYEGYANNGQMFPVTSETSAPAATSGFTRNEPKRLGSYTGPLGHNPQPGGGR